ncbi:uncharacterized protein LOC126669950 [Mercurialis annua]|uniref:uncharacterized protein LOC126669950 n=1 Tax=Mercurialis annua TaxID=3986 RepID=UPI00215F853A|nr:uncharacterized protein LOC126669950 [Mercurialis annua]
MAPQRPLLLPSTSHATINTESAMHDLISRTNNMTFAEPRLSLHRTPAHIPTIQRLVLVGKFLLKAHRFTASAVRYHVDTSWNIPSVVEIDSAANGLFTFRFHSEEAYHMVLNEQPWQILNQLIILKEWPLHVPIKHTQFSTTAFWVQVRGPSPDQLNATAAAEIGAIFSKFLAVDFDDAAPLWR